MVLVANSEAAAGVVDNLDAATEVEGEVELGGAVDGNLSAEVEKASRRLSEWLHLTVAAEVEFQTDRRGARSKDALPLWGKHGEATSRRRQYQTSV